MTAELTTIQARLLREAAENGGSIYIGEWSEPAERKTAKALVRAGMLSCGTPRGRDHHGVTDHGREWLMLDEQERSDV